MLDPSLWLWLPLIVAATVALVISRTESKGAILLLGAGALCCVVALTASAAWSWLLRDGLGPDAVTSSGWTAFGRFWGSIWPALVLTSLFAATISIVSWRRWFKVASGISTTASDKG